MNAAADGQDDEKSYSGRRALGSAAWASMQQFVTTGSAALTGILLARHLTVADYGLYSYATTLAVMGTMVMTAGLSGLAVKALVHDRANEARTMTALVLIRELFAALGYTAFLLISLTSDDDVATAVTAISLVVLFARGLDASELWFQSRAESKYTAPVRIGAVVAALVARVVGIMLGLDLTGFIIIYVAEAVLTSGGLLWRYLSDRRSPRFAKPDLETPKNLLGDSWLLLLGGIANQVNTRADIPLLQALSGATAVGLYSAAARLSELFYFLPAVFMTAYFPRLLNIRKVHGPESARYRREMQRAYDLACWVGILIAVVVVLVGPWALTLLYGEAYESAGSVLRIHVIALPFVFMGAVFSKWILAEGYLVASLTRHVLGAGLNVGLNVILIPHYGILGAAYATVVSYAVAQYLSCFASKNTRPAGVQMTLAIVWPLRLAVHAATALRDRMKNGQA